MLLQQLSEVLVRLKGWFLIEFGFAKAMCLLLVVDLLLKFEDLRERHFAFL